MTKEIERSNKCSQCGFKVEVHSKRYTEYVETLEFLFPKFVAPNDIPSVSIEGTSYITIINLTGESITVEYKPDTTIEGVKKKIKKKMKIPLEQQVLLYKGDELKVCARTVKWRICKTYIPSKHKLHLLDPPCKN